MVQKGQQRIRHLGAPETAVIALVAFTVFRVTAPIWTLAIKSLRLPQWDMAKYGVSGLRLARSLQDLDPLAFFRHLNSLDVWPPVFPILEVPAFLVAGPGYGSARGLVALLFAAAVMAAFWCGMQSNTRWGIAVGALIATLVATSPMAHIFATVVMLEIPGTALLLIAVGSYVRSLRSDRTQDFTVACIAATALFFCKYNYGLIWLLPMAVNELQRSGLMSTAILRRLGAALRRPWPAVVTGGLLLAVIIETAGPWRFALFGREISVSSAGPLLYGLYVVFVLSRILRPRRSLEAVTLWLGNLERRARTMVLAIAVPIGLWMVVPAHAINFVRFLVNRAEGPPVSSLDSLLFYPRAFIGEFSSSQAVGAVVLLLAALSLRRLRGSDETGRVVALALAFSAVAAVAHPYKQPRFFFMTAALVWIAGSREAIELVARASSRAREGTQRWIAATVAGLSLVATASVGVDIDRLHEGHRRHTVHAATAEVLDGVTDHAVEARSSVLLGTWNNLSPWLVEWSCLQRRPAMEVTQVPRFATGRRHRENIIGWLLADRPELLMVVSTSPDSSPRPGLVRETRWLDPVRRRLARDPRFRLVSREDFPDAGYRLESFEPARTNREPVPR